MQIDRNCLLVRFLLVVATSILQGEMLATDVGNPRKVNHLYSFYLIINLTFLVSEDKTRVKKLGVEIGKDAAEKSKGLFSADDWMCTKYSPLNKFLSGELSR